MKETAREPGLRSPLNTVVAEMIRKVAADDEDRISQIAVVAAVDELIELDQTRADSWYLEGLSYGFGLRDGERASTVEAIELRRVIGILDAAVERRDHDRLAEVGLRHESQVRKIIEGEQAEAAVAPMLLALLGRHPERAVNLAVAAPRPFVGWEVFVARAEDRGRALADAWEPDRAAVVITGLAGVIAAWRAAGADDQILSDAALRLTVERASLHRQAGDFETAEQLLDEAAAESDGATTIAGLHVERGLAMLHLARLDDVRMARAFDGEIESLAPSLRAARASIVAAVEEAPSDPVANLLAGVSALADGTPSDAVRHLEVAAEGVGHRMRPSFHALLRERVEALRAS